MAMDKLHMRELPDYPGNKVGRSGWEAVGGV